MTPRRQILQVDKETGEEIGSALVEKRLPRAPSPYGDDWMQSHQRALLQIAADRELRGIPSAVYLYVSAKLDYHNYFCVSPTDISRDINVGRNSATAALQLLAKKDILLGGPKVGNTKSFKLNPLYGWRGSVIGLKKELGRHDAVAIARRRWDEELEFLLSPPAEDR